jgi:hypothetical protein
MFRSDLRVTKHWVAGYLALISAIVTITEGVTRSQTLTIMAAAITLGATLAIARLSIFRSGLDSFLPAHSERNAEVFDDIRDSYCYLGVTFSMAEAFASWYEKNHRTGCKIRILITDSHKDWMDRQVGWQEADRWRAKSAAEKASELAALAEERREDQVSHLRKLARLPNSAGSIEVRYHQQRIHQWLHLVNKQYAWIGLLRSGESGRECPAIIAKRLSDGKGLYEHYEGWFESLWAEGREADLQKFLAGKPVGAP